MDNVYLVEQFSKLVKIYFCWLSFCFDTYMSYAWGHSIILCDSATQRELTYFHKCRGRLFGDEEELGKDLPYSDSGDYYFVSFFLKKLVKTSIL